MQAQWNDVPTDFFSDNAFERQDDANDVIFYQRPRLVSHVDQTASGTRISNGTAFGLSSGVCTNDFRRMKHYIQRLAVGTVNIWEVPGYRIEMSPFGGIKDSGLGYKEGVLEAMRSFTNVKTFSLPWSE